MAGLGDMNSLISRWLAWLPIWEDAEETGHVYGYLCDLVEANNAAVLGGPANDNLPRIVAAIARVLAEKTLLRPGQEDEDGNGVAKPPGIDSNGGDAQQQVNGKSGAPCAFDRCASILKLIQVSLSGDLNGHNQAICAHPD